jgi:hypothetical protein
VVLAALSLSVPKVLLDLDGLLRLVPTLLAAAERASVECGWAKTPENAPGRTPGRREN